MDRIHSYSCTSDEQKLPDSVCFRPFLPAGSHRSHHKHIPWSGHSIPLIPDKEHIPVQNILSRSRVRWLLPKDLCSSLRVRMLSMLFPGRRYGCLLPMRLPIMRWSDYPTFLPFLREPTRMVATRIVPVRQAKHSCSVLA